MHNNRIILIAWVLAAGFFAFTAVTVFAEEDACEGAWQDCCTAANTRFNTCLLNANGDFETISGCNDQLTSDGEACDNTYDNCEAAAAAAGNADDGDDGGSIIASRGTNFFWALNDSILQKFSTGTNTSTSQVLGPGVFYVTTNSAGVVQPIDITVGLWDGSEYVPDSTVTNVEIFTMPVSVMSEYGPTNFAQLPWVNAGQAVQETNNLLWELLWTPDTNTEYAIYARIYDSSNGLFHTVALAVPPPKHTIITQPTFSTSGKYSFTIIGPIGGNRTVQFAPSLNPGNVSLTWTNVLTITNFTGQAEFGDSSTNTIGFYRVLVN